MSGEIAQLALSLNPGTVDAIVSGHVHDVDHHYVNGIPVIQSINGGFYSNVIYMTFNSTTKSLINTRIEGPMPSCEKVFEGTQ